MLAAFPCFCRLRLSLAP